MMNHSHDSTITSAHGHDHNSDTDAQDPHEKNMWRGFVAMLGLIFFFFMEKCLTLGAEWRKQRQLRKNQVISRFPHNLENFRDTIIKFINKCFKMIKM